VRVVSGTEASQETAHQSQAHLRSYPRDSTFRLEGHAVRHLLGSLRRS